MDEIARAFHQPHRSAGDCFHRGQDELLLGYVVDEEKHPGAQGLERRHGGGKALFGGGKLLHFAAVDGFDESIAVGKVPVKRPGANAGLPGDVIEAGNGSFLGEDLFGDFENVLAISLRVGADFTCGRRRGLLFRHIGGTKNLRQFFATGDSPRLSH
jgi:hypothetical protein